MSLQGPRDHPTMSVPRYVCRKSAMKCQHQKSDRGDLAALRVSAGVEYWPPSWWSAEARCSFVIGHIYLTQLARSA
jgi:hypothetical protein